jgi:hypothetical protein
VSPGGYRPVDPARLADVIAGQLAAATTSGSALRVAVDGCSCADPVGFATALEPPLRTLSRPVAVVRADSFWRDASLRLEYGHTDVQSFTESWLDDGALTREVLGPLGPGGSGQYLPSLRDPVTSRSTRAARATAGPGTVVIVAGSLLLGRGLDFDVTVHLSMNAATRARRMPAELAWTLPAYVDYERAVDPEGVADVVIRVNDPRHPALWLRVPSQ